MKRVRRVYVTERYGRVDSDDPRLSHSGMLSVAFYFGALAARREFGDNAVLVDVIEGERHRMKPGQRKRMPTRSRLDISGFWDYYFVVKKPMGCGIPEHHILAVPIRVTRARGSREYYEEPAFTPPPKLTESPPFRKRG